MFADFGLTSVTVTHDSGTRHGLNVPSDRSRNMIGSFHPCAVYHGTTGTLVHTSKPRLVWTSLATTH